LSKILGSSFKPRKKWGQHFLVDRRVVQCLITAAEIKPNEIVLEIGPGLGALTRELARCAAKLYLVEIDPELVRRLHEEFAGKEHVIVIAGDFLLLNLSAAFPEEKIKVVANLPYNVATPILFRLIAERQRFPQVMVTLQKEVAERLSAAPGSKAYGALSVLVQLYARVEKKFVVAPGSFSPPPQVESQVVFLTLQEAQRVPLADEEVFRRVVRAAFGQRRKTLRNALKGLLSNVAQDPFLQTGIDPSRRGETLSLEEFAALANSVTRHLQTEIKKAGCALNRSC
jgi:16S rRNA (adenine1518-N6/adenine1519-N6)-dimethyltransferase